MTNLRVLFLSILMVCNSTWAVLPNELPVQTAQSFQRGIEQVRETNKALIAELDRAIEADKAIQENKERIKQLQQDNANIARQQQAARQAAQDVANAAQQAANAANLANTPMGGGGGGGGGGKGGGGGGGGRGMMNGVEAAEIMPSKGTEFAQPGGDVDIGNAIGAMASQGYSPMPAAQPFASSTYQPALGSLTQPLSQEMTPGAIAARKGLMLQGGARTANPIADGAAAMAAAALASGAGAGGKPGGGAQGANGMPPGGGGGGGDNMSSVGRGEMDGDSGKRPTVLASAEGAAGGGGEGAASGEATGEEEIAPSKGPNSMDTFASSPGKHTGESNPIPQGLMTWVGWVDHVCKSESGKTLVGVCLGGTRMAATGVAPLTTSVAEAMAKLAPSAVASDRAVASVAGEAKPKATAGTGSNLLDLVSRYSK